MTGEDLLASVYAPNVSQRLDSITNLGAENTTIFVVAHNHVEEIANLIDISPNAAFARLASIADHRLKACLRQTVTYDYIAANHSLRSALELHLAGIEFSVNEFKYREWDLGKRDINWKSMVDKEIGVFSKNFTFAFYPDLVDLLTLHRSVAMSLYSSCSRYVHCNPSATSQSILADAFNEEEFLKIVEKVSSLRTVAYFGFLLRFADTLTADSFLKIESAVMDIFGHTAEIRKLYE